jgi:hypothetical protein
MPELQVAHLESVGVFLELQDTSAEGQALGHKHSGHDLAGGRLVLLLQASSDLLVLPLLVLQLVNHELLVLLLCWVCWADGRVRRRWWWSGVRKSKYVLPAAFPEAGSFFFSAKGLTNFPSSSRFGTNRGMFIFGSFSLTLAETWGI